MVKNLSRRHIASVLSVLALLNAPDLAHSSYQPRSIANYEVQPISPAVVSERYTGFILARNPNLQESEALHIAEQTTKWASQFALDEKLLLAIMSQESSFVKSASSHAGAKGLMQVLPKYHRTKLDTAKVVVGTSNLFSVETSIYLGAWIFRECLNRYSTVKNALRCYEGSVGKRSEYDKLVLKNYQELLNTL